MKKIIIIFVLVLFSCSENKKDVNTDADNGGTNGGNGGMKPMKDRVGKIHYAASTPCQAGDYSDYPHGLKTITIECEHDGKVSKVIFFYPFLNLSHAKNYNTLSKNSEILFRSDGTRDRFTQFSALGNKQLEFLYRADGTQRKYQQFNNDGTVSSTTYYMADGETFCAPSSTKCVDSDPE